MLSLRNPMQVALHPYVRRLEESLVCVVLAAAVDSFLDLFAGFVIWTTSVVVQQVEKKHASKYPAGTSRFEPVVMR
jgi:hypothetical protein